MTDLLLIATAGLFFALSAVLVRAFGRMRRP